MALILMSDLFLRNLNIHSSGTIRDRQGTYSIYMYYLFHKFKKLNVKLEM